ncbi:MAG: phage holin family protein [Clostridia bacterium]|nr:phage holin family protein [Clostridia bacterium]
MAVRNHYARPPGYDEDRAFAPPRRESAGFSPGQTPGAVGDTVVLSLLFVIAPACGVLGLFLSTFLWAFVIVAAMTVLAMWAVRCFESGRRAFLSGVLVVLIGMALMRAVSAAPRLDRNGEFPVYGEMPPNALDLQAQGIVGANTAGDDGLPMIADPHDPQPEATPSATYSASSSRIMPVAAVEGSAPTAPPQQAEASGQTQGVGEQPADAAQSVPSNGAEQVLHGYLQMWSEKNFEGMVQYTSRSWQQQLKTPPSRQLSYEHSRWEIQNWTMSPQPEASTASVSVIVVEANLIKGTSDRTPASCRYTASVILDGGAWYVDPDTLRGTPIPSGLQENLPEPEYVQSNALAEPTISPSLTLWYNPDGGQKYHLRQNCPDINPKFHSKMLSFSYSEVGEHSKLRHCTTCEAPRAQKR